MVQRRITRGRHADNLGGATPSRLISNSPPSIPPFLCQMPFLPQPSQFILAWDKHRNILDCIPPWHGFRSNKRNKKLSYHRHFVKLLVNNRNNTPHLIIKVIPMLRFNASFNIKDWSFWRRSSQLITYMVTEETT